MPYFAYGGDKIYFGASPDLSAASGDCFSIMISAQNTFSYNIVNIVFTTASKGVAGIANLFLAQL